VNTPRPSCKGPWQPGGTSGRTNGTDCKEELGLGGQERFRYTPRNVHVANFAKLFEQLAQLWRCRLEVKIVHLHVHVNAHRSASKG
jgi:hypothetical protein